MEGCKSFKINKRGGWNIAAKGQLISKANCQAVNSSKKRTNEFVVTTMRRVFVPFLEEIEDSKKAFRNYLTFKNLIHFVLHFKKEFNSIVLDRQEQ